MVPCVLPTRSLAPMSAQQALTEFEPDAIAVALQEFSAHSFHARQIYQWIYKRGVTDFSQMTDLSQNLRTQLATQFTIPTPTVSNRSTSSDGTVKFLMDFGDDQQVETVFIPDTPAMTFCVSTQVGCAMQCTFCLTGKMGLLRNLTAGEIVGQVRVMAHDLKLVDRRFNIVLMGMGEPLHNYDETMKALRILGADCGLAVGPRRITLSTVGVLPALERLAGESIMPNLAVSLHATTEELRNRLVPVNQKYGLAELIAACRRFPTKRRDHITFEYVLLREVNDSVADAQRLAKLLSGIRAKVNIIPLNEAVGIPYRRPSDHQINEFASTLAESDLIVSVRKSRGRDIRAACGQLLVEGTNPSPAQEAAQQLNQ